MAGHQPQPAPGRAGHWSCNLGEFLPDSLRIMPGLDRVTSPLSSQISISASWKHSNEERYPDCITEHIRLPAAAGARLQVNMSW